MNKIMPWVPILTGILSIVSFLLFFKFDNPTFAFVFMLLSIVYPIIGIIYSLVLRRKYFRENYIALWIVGFVLNLLIFLFYVVIIGFLIFIIVFIGRAFGAFA